MSYVRALSVPEVGSALHELQARLPSLGSYQILTKGNWVGQGIIWFTHYRHHQGKPRQEQKQRPQENAAYWLDFHDLLLQLSYTAQGHLPRGETTHGVQKALPHQAAIKKMPYRHADRPI